MSTFEESAGAYLATVDHDKSNDWVAGFIAAIVWARDHDAQVRAEALREAADAFESAEINVQVFGDGPDAEYWKRSNESRRHFVASLRARADRIEKEADQ